MAERPSKRSRVMSEDSEGTDDWLPQAMSMNNRPGQANAAPSRSADAASRARRGPSQDPQRPIRLTVKKTAPSRLKEYTGDSSDNDDDDSKRKRRSLGRESKNKKPIVDRSSDEEAEDDEDEAGVDEEEEDDDDDEEEEDEEDGEEEEDDNDQDMDVDEDEGDDTPMSDTPAPARPTIKLSAPRGEPKTTPTARLKQAGITPVEEKELASSAAASEDDDDDEDDEDPEEDPPDLQNMPEDDEDVDDTIRADGLADSELDSSDDEAGASGKGNARRRRAISPSNLMALSNEAQKKKFFTADEISMRRAEMARRRKDLSEKRNEEEKANTLKRLLEKPAPTRRSRAQVLADLEREEFGPGRAAADDDPERDGPRARPTFVRSVLRLHGSAVGVPREWLAAPAGRLFDASRKPAAEGDAWDPDTRERGRMVQVVE